MCHVHRSLQVVFIAGLAFAGIESPARAQPSPAGPATVLPHPAESRWWLSGQLNVIRQAHGRFTSPYAGDNSLKADREHATSLVWTLYTGVKVTKRTALLLDVESAGGRGLGDALGLAGFTNLDVVRNPTLGSAPYVARAMVHITIPLGPETLAAAPGPLTLAAHLPARRIEVRAGKFSMADFFDANAAGGDSHLQFTNWTVDNNGAYDYAADTRGYTFGVMTEYDTAAWSIRFAAALMPKLANGIDLDWNVARARAENLELELRPAAGLAVRLLGYANHANMGSYGEAIAAFRAGRDPHPDVVRHRAQGRLKTGVGLNVEYTFPRLVRTFARAGWNEGHHESFAYTEVNHSVQAGGDVQAGLGKRPLDRVGVAFVSNGLSPAHRDYLRLGGLGFLLGDGTLRYGRENIVETYYTAHLWRGVWAAAGLQHIDHPGYNRDRGPVFVKMLRCHVDF
jgi:hypothetical protein